ncbi:MAG: hypothetical protein AAGA23_03170 [Pseudomonadota bacterium]
MIYLFIVATLITLVINLRPAFELPSEADVSRMLSGDLRYRKSLFRLFGSMGLGLLFMGVAAFFAISDVTPSDPTLVFGLLFYYPAYYWVSALGYSEVAAWVLKERFAFDDPKLRPRLFAITRDRAQRVHAIMAVLFSLVLIGKTEISDVWAAVIVGITVLGWMAWIPVNFYYFKSTAKAIELAYPDQFRPGITAVLVGIGFAFHMMLGLFVPFLIIAAPFVLPKILRRDRELAPT